MTAPIRIAVVGMGKIAHDQHLPAVFGDPRFELAATVSRNDPGVGGVPAFKALDSLAQADVDIDAIALCTPPQIRREMATRAMDQGWHVFLEKPPASSLAEVEALTRTAVDADVTLFASWHSRYAAAVKQARIWLATRELISAQIIWREDVRIWHPEQDWIWQPGGFGVFDPGINALSIATHILPHLFFLDAADLFVPSNRAAPIAVQAHYRDEMGAGISLDLDFREEGTQIWSIIAETHSGTLTLADGGSRLTISGGSPVAPIDNAPGEYPALYARFADLIEAGLSDVDVSPLRHVADAFLRGRQIAVEPFVD